MSRSSDVRLRLWLVLTLPVFSVLSLILPLTHGHRVPGWLWAMNGAVVILCLGAAYKISRERRQD